MGSALLLSALFAQDPTTIRLDADRPILVRGVPFRLTIQSDPSIAGEALVRGLRNITRVRLESGRAELAQAIPDGEVIVVVGTTTRKLDRRVIPGWLCLIPPILSILLAVTTRRVILSLFLGIWVGILVRSGFGLWEIPKAAVRVVDTAVLHSLTDSTHAILILFILLMGGMIGIMARSGGMKGVMDTFSRRVRSRRGGMLSTWALGMAMSFDDYSNLLVVGNTMRPLTDRLRISREKLAYLVDSTAGPMATLFLVSTWVVAEMRGLTATGIVHPDHVYGVFAGMIPFSFYSIFALALVFLIAVTVRDFGPMLRAELRAVTTGQVLRLGGRPMMDRDIAEVSQVEDLSSRWHNAVFPIAAFVGITAAGFVVSGYRNAPPGETTFWHVLGYADSLRIPLWGAMGGTLVAVLLAGLRKHLSLVQVGEAWLRGCKALLVPIVILVLAWAMSQTCKDLSVGRWTAEHVRTIASPRWLPALVFLACAAVSFGTASSWGTLALMCPVMVPLAWSSPDEGIRYGTLAAILSGSLLGDNLSPITDTTLFSSIASASDHIDHVKTQAPYALVAACVALVCGFIPAGFGVSPWISLPAGFGVLAATIFLVGKKVPAVSDL